MARRAPMIAVAWLTISAACARHPNLAQVAPVPREPNTLTAEDQRRGWALLFDGRSLAGWHAYRKDFGITDGWRAGENAVVSDSTTPLVSDLQFGSFELELEWKGSPGALGSLSWWANEGTSRIEMNAPALLLEGPHEPRDNPDLLRMSGAVIGLWPVLQTPPVPTSEWNTTVLRVRGSKIEEWINGVRILEANFDARAMTRAIASSPFKDYPTFGKSRRGHLGLQSERGTLWFRNIRIKEFE